MTESATKNISSRTTKPPSTACIIILPEYANLDELNYLASVLDELPEDDLEKLEAAVEYGDHTGSVKDIINLVQNLDCYDYYPDIHNEEDLGCYNDTSA